MNRDEIMSMPAEQLCIEIARRMGWADIFVENTRLIGSYRGAFGRMCPIPEYPNEIGAVMPLLAEMVDEGLTIGIYKENGLWVFDTDEDQTWVMSKQLPDAISRAWLMWKEKNENEPR